MFLPFSMGPRFCIGRPFAMLEMKIMLARIMARYTLPQPPDHPVEVEPLLVVRPRGGMALQVAPLESGTPAYDKTLPEFASLT
jgi:cytochrome P450